MAGEPGPLNPDGTPRTIWNCVACWPRLCRCDITPREENKATGEKR